jgi:hypothetical protein
MRSMKAIGIISLCVLALSLAALAGEKSLGVADVRHITFSDPVRIGTTLFKPGEYEVRHTMAGEEHIMLFKIVGTKDQIKVKCTLVPLTQKADQTRTVYELDAANTRVVRELVFRGDTAKHVF